MVPLTIAAAQSKSVPGDFRANLAHHLRFARAAAEQGVQLLVFPELSLISYELSLARANAMQADDVRLDPLRSLAASAGMTIVVGAPLLPNETELHIAALVLNPEGTVSTYRKVHVHESELGVFGPGPGGINLNVEDVQVALAICADATFPSHAAKAAERGAKLYAVGAMITESGYARKSALLEGYARQHGMAVLLANYSGVTGQGVSAGKSAIWTENGGLVAASTGNEEALVLGRKRDGVWQGMVIPMDQT